VSLNRYSRSWRLTSLKKRSADLASSPLIDSHCHVQSREFDADRDAVLVRAREAGLEAMVVVGWNVASSASAVAMAQQHDYLYAVVGCHPHDAKDLDDTALAQIEELAQQPKVVAIGEIGLDFYRDLSPRETQASAFRNQLQLAAELQMPVVIHSRDADTETFEILEPWAKRVASEWTLGCPIGVMHCYAGDLELAKQYIEIGFMISIPGIVTYQNAEKMAQVAKGISPSAMLVETDCPYLTPRSRRGRRNEPAYVAETAEKIAELRSEPVGDVARATSENTRRLFGIPKATATKEFTAPA
jgi:TatD DNase family protein